MVEQIIVFSTIILALVLFIHGHWRYDLVALSALLLLVFTGVLPGNEGFYGFGHPAVITVAAVMIVSRGLLYSGLVDSLARGVFSIGENLVLQLLVMVTLVTLLSAFINNVGALSIFLPVALRTANRSGRHPSLYLMPLAFGSLLGGMITMIGTPPNIIIAMFRTQKVGVPFGMFDFTPVGLMVALSGVILIVLFGWRLIPHRQGEGIHRELFHIEDYMCEVRILPGSRFIGSSLRELSSFGDQNVVVAALLRDEHQYPSPSSLEPLKVNDTLIIEAEANQLKDFVEEGGLKLVGRKNLDSKDLEQGDFDLFEVVVMPHSPMVNSTVKSLNLRWQYGVNLLAVARQGVRLKDRLVNIVFKAGDILLIQGNVMTLQDTLSSLGCLPLAERELRLRTESRLLPSIIIFSITLLLVILELIPVQIALLSAALAMVMAGIVSLRRVYESIEWPVIILLGSMISIGQALEKSGGAETLSYYFLELGSLFPPVVTLLFLMLITMVLANVINTAAAAVLMAPIAANLASGMGVSMDPLLMGVAIAASSSFLTPIGHQSNILVMGSGGYRFGDYWRLGLPLSLTVLAVSIPLLLYVWPF